MADRAAYIRAVLSATRRFATRNPHAEFAESESHAESAEFAEL